MKPEHTAFLAPWPPSDMTLLQGQEPFLTHLGVLWAQGNDIFSPVDKV